MTISKKPALRQPEPGDEIDLLEIAKTIKNGRRSIIKTVIITGILGLIIALLSPKEYTATTILVPQTSSANKLGGLSSLAAMAGFNLDNMESASDILSPVVYPQIVSSVPFQLDLMNSEFTIAKVNHPVTLYEYYTKIKKSRFSFLFRNHTTDTSEVNISALKSERKEKGPIVLTKKQDEVKNIINKNIFLKLDAKLGSLTIETSFPEPLLSAEVADRVQELLQKYVTDFKIKKVSNKLAFIEGRYDEKKKDFEKIQVQLARFRDQNKNVSSQVARTEEERLQSEYTIAMNVYNDLAKQLEQAKIQVKEETPTFSVIQPAVVPEKKSSPRTILIFFISIFIGGFAGISLVFGKIWRARLQAAWNEKSD